MASTGAGDGQLLSHGGAGAELDLVGCQASVCGMRHHPIVLLDMERHELLDSIEVVQGV